MPVQGIRILVTSGPTHEPIDPVRFIGNRSSGKQGHAIAKALAEAGADVILISGPVCIPDPQGVNTIHVMTAREMLAACEAALPVQIAICAAAVSDWRPVVQASQKMKKNGDAPPVIELVENPDILKILSHHMHRPKLVVGFAAETQNMVQNANAKLRSKGCDWILANDVSGGKGFEAEINNVTFLTAHDKEEWGTLPKIAIAKKLTDTIIKHLTSPHL